MQKNFNPLRFRVILTWIFLLGTSFPCLLWGQTYTVESVPNMKVKANQLVSNPDQILSPLMEARINQVLDSLEKQTSAQVAVVMVNSIGEESEFDFAQALFKKWGIGQAGNDNGLLILYVSDKRVIRFHTGFGLEGMLPDVICKRIQMQRMVPHFKEGNIDEGMMEGIAEVRKILTDPAYAAEINEEVNPKPIEWKDEDWLGVGLILSPPWILIFTIAYFVKRKSGFANSVNGPGVDKPTTLLNKSEWVWLYIVVPPFLFVGLSFLMDGWLFLAGVYGYFGLLVSGKRVKLQTQTNRFVAKEEFHALYQFYSDNKAFWLAMAILFPVPFAFLYGPYLRVRSSFRTHPRKCKNCASALHLLNDQAEDEYLKKSMLLEEEIKSVDYDVWRCSHCQSLSIEVYYNEKTTYTSCPKCHTIAFHETSRRTVTEATTTASGSREITSECKFCNHLIVLTETIPMIVVSTSSSSGSSSSDSGGSFGGGDSGGGGASSSW